jgi:hypothetical protein
MERRTLVIVMLGSFVAAMILIIIGTVVLTLAAIDDTTQAAPRDADGDGIANSLDNCRDVYNPQQYDQDGDGIGSVCDPDKDGDGRPNEDDYDPTDPNVQDAPDPQPPPSSCVGTHINPGDDLDAIVNADPEGSATTFCIHGGTYSLSASLNVRAGDKLIGESGTLETKGPATYPTSVPVKIINGAGLSRLMTVYGSNVRLEWLDLSGAKGTYVSPQPTSCANWGDSGKCPIAGTGMAIGTGNADGTLVMERLRIHDNEALGIGSANGKILESNFFSNSTNRDWWGFESASVKGVDEYEIARSYVHDEQANGIWCDHGCVDVPSQPNGFWAHHNLVVNNDRWGIRYEYSPRVADGVHASQPTALVELNEVHGNGSVGPRGGISMENAQNGTFRLNTFGAVTIGGTSYTANANNRAILFANPASRTDLWNGDAINNTLNGETIVGCDMADTVVFCSGNS